MFIFKYSKIKHSNINIMNRCCQYKDVKVKRCLTDCSVLRTPTILPEYSHIVKLALHFYAHIGAGH